MKLIKKNYKDLKAGDMQIFLVDSLAALILSNEALPPNTALYPMRKITRLLFNGKNVSMTDYENDCEVDVLDVNNE